MGFFRILKIELDVSRYLLVDPLRQVFESGHGVDFPILQFVIRRFFGQSILLYADCVIFLESAQGISPWRAGPESRALTPPRQ